MEFLAVSIGCPNMLADCHHRLEWEIPHRNRDHLLQEDDPGQSQACDLVCTRTTKPFYEFASRRATVVDALVFANLLSVNCP